MPKGTCSVDGCERSILARHMCSMHYNRWNTYGSTDAPRPPYEERFWAKAEKTETCWNWSGYVDPQLGYGHTWYQGRQERAHRVAFKLATHEAIPKGMMIDHICHNRRCVNPDHLRLVTMKQNQENRAAAPRKNTSGVRGVSWNVGNQRWLVTIGHNGKTVYGGQYKDLGEAEQAAIALRNSLFTHNDLDRGESVA